MVESFKSGPCGLDFESNGPDPTAQDFEVRTVGLANDSYCISLDLLGAQEADLSALWAFLSTLEYVAHNCQFEGGVLKKYSGSIGNMICDTFGVFGHLATERRQPLGLDAAMDELLGLKKEGDKVKDHMKANKWTWADVNKFDFEILGRYNAIDAYGHWELYKYFCKVVDSYKDTWGQYFWQFHREDFLIGEVENQIEAKFLGIDIDEKELKSTLADHIGKQHNAMNAFLNNDEIETYINEYNSEILKSYIEGEPPKHKKNGDIAVRWENWNNRTAEVTNTQHFNTNSSTQLRWLFFEKMGLIPHKYTDKGEPSTDEASLKQLGIHGALLLKYRKLTTEIKFMKQIDLTMVDGKIRPSVKVPGTVSSRAAGGSL